MKYLLVVACLFFIGCSSERQTVHKDLPSKQNISRFTMTNNTQIDSFNSVYVLRDSKTEREYMIVRAPEAVAVIELEN